MRYRVIYYETVKHEAVIESSRRLTGLHSNGMLCEAQWYPQAAQEVVSGNGESEVVERWVDDAAPCGPEATNPPTGTNYGT